MRPRATSRSTAPRRRTPWAFLAAGAALTAAPAGAQPPTPAGPGHDAHPAVACVDVAPGTPRPTYGCFNLAHVTGLTFADSLVTWYVFRFPTRAAADAARSAHGVVVEEDSAVWLGELTPARAPAPAPGGTLVARVGPLALPPAPAYTATYAYTVLRPGERSRVHVHAGPEAFYVVAGAQCVDMPAGAVRTGAGETAVAPANVPMELAATGQGVRRALVLVLHDGREPQARPVAWQPPGRCRD